MSANARHPVLGFLNIVRPDRQRGPQAGFGAGLQLQSLFYNREPPEPCHFTTHSWSPRVENLPVNTRSQHEALQACRNAWAPRAPGLRRGRRGRLGGTFKAFLAVPVKADHPLAAVCPFFSSCTSSKNTAAIYTQNLVQAEDDAHFTELRHLVGALAVEHSGPLGFRPWGLQRLRGDCVSAESGTSVALQACLDRLGIPKRMPES